MALMKGTLWLTQSLQRLLRPKSVAILEACLIGLVSALAAVLLKQAIAAMESWTAAIGTDLPPLLILPVIGLLGGLLSGWLIERAAPEATGSGIPQVKAALGYASIALDLRVAVVKLVSTTLALGAGLGLGRQGPTVQIGAALAGQFSRWLATSPAYQRQLVAAGAAAGLAAGFNAPIAGVLFVIEELLQDLSELTLGTAILAAFVGGVVSRLLGGRGLIPDLSGIDLSFTLMDIPVLMLLGAIAGVLGASFNRGILTSLRFYRQYLPGWRPSWQMGLAGAISGMILAFLPPILRSSSDTQDLLVLGEIGWQITAIAFVGKFLLVLLAYGSGVPGGLFAPSLILGSALGGLIGQIAQAVQLELNGIVLSHAPVIYTLTGMGAFFSAVTRGPITAIVIVFELTMDFDVVLPLMIGSVVAYLVAEKVSKGSIYTHLLEFRGIQLDQKFAGDQQLQGLLAADIMQRRVETLPAEMTIAAAIQFFEQSHHRGFPVVADGRLVGMVTQSDLARIRVRGLNPDLPLSQIMTQRLISVGPGDRLAHVLYLLNHYQISRLPVTEGRKLVGIITRADIIRAECDRLSGEASPLKVKPAPSYPVYQTQSPTTAQGRLLVPLSNPQTTDALLRLAAAIAQQHHYDLECLHIIPIPRHSRPSETSVDITASRQMMEHAVAGGQTWQVPVHSQIRVAQDIASAILETIRDRHIDLVLMGWEGVTLTPGRIFGTVVDTIVREASCNVVLVRPGKQLILPLAKAADLSGQSALTLLMRLFTLNRWLIPVAGGPNAQYALTLLPALVALSQHPQIRLCQVFSPSEPYQDTTLLEQDADFLNQQLQAPVITVTLCADSVADAIVDLVEKDQCDVIVLGASREGLLQQVIQGNIPEQIARHSDCTVILVRQALSPE